MKAVTVVVIGAVLGLAIWSFHVCDAVKINNKIKSRFLAKACSGLAAASLFLAPDLASAGMLTFPLPVSTWRTAQPSSMHVSPTPIPYAHAH